MSEDDPQWLDRALFPFTSRFLNIAGNRVHYIDEGSGPTLLLLHGNPTWSFLYRHIVHRLAQHFRCIALDYPGFGLSRAAPGYGYNPREHSTVLERFVDALDLSDLGVRTRKCSLRPVRANGPGTYAASNDGRFRSGLSRPGPGWASAAQT